MTKTKQIFITTLSLMLCVMLCFMFSACKISLGGGGNSDNNGGGGGVTTPQIEKRILYLGADSTNTKLTEGSTYIGNQISNLETQIESEANETKRAQLQNQKAELEAGKNVIDDIKNKNYFSITKTTTQDENNNPVDVYDAKTSEILSPFFNDAIAYSNNAIYFQYGDNALNDIAKWQVKNENNWASIYCYKKYASADSNTNFEFWIIKFYYNESLKKITNFEYNYIDSITTNITVNKVTYNGSAWTAVSTQNDSNIENMTAQANTFASGLTPTKVTYNRTQSGDEYSYSKILPE